MEQERTDSELLEAFAVGGDAGAFGQIVRRHADLVYAAAVRQVGPQLADDVAQAVFVILHRKAKDVNGATLAGWLVKAARLAGMGARRDEHRRKQREQKAAAMRNDVQDDHSDGSDTPWAQVAPLLDGALAWLGEKDRCAVTLHYLEGKTAAEVARAMGSSEYAAARRASRAVLKLRRYFAGHGIHLSGQMLGEIMVAHGSLAAPAALVAKMTAATATVGATAAAAAATSSSTTGSVAQTAMSMMAAAKAQTLAVAATVVVLAGAAGTVLVHELTASPTQATTAPATAPVLGTGLKVVRATTRPQPWRLGPIPADLASSLPRESFTRFKTPPGQSASFTGRVEGLKPGATAEVGIVSMRGVQWTSNTNYQWKRVGPDGTFSITSDRHPDAKRALAVRTRGRPVTFLRAEFAPDESGKEIALRIKPGRTVTLTARGRGGAPVSWFKAEVFNAYDEVDDQGHPLDMQRLDSPATSNGKLSLDLPLEPVALLISGTGVAPYYHVLDARDADTFQFDLMAPCRITGTVTRSGGLEPVPNQRVMMYNNSAPLSATARKTDAAGAFDLPAGVPGTYQISIAGKRFALTAAEAETLAVTLDLDTGEVTPTAAPPAN